MMAMIEEDPAHFSSREKNAGHFQLSDLDHIRKLATEVQRALENMPDPAGVYPAKHQPQHPLTCAKRLEKERRQRSKFFPEQLVWDPAWPMLVELFRCRAEKIELSVTSLSISVDVPAATGRRWIEEFDQRSLIDRWHSKSDARRTLVRMNDSGFKRMEDYLLSIC